MKQMYNFFASPKAAILKFTSILSILMLIGVMQTMAQTIYVNDGSGDDSWTGENATNVPDGTGPKKTITAGTTVVAEGGTVIVAGTSYAESGVTITKNLTLNSSGTFTINNYLTVSGGKTITLTGDLIVGGALTLTSASDILTIGANKTLTLNGSISGDGYLAGTGFSNLTISGSSGAFGTMNVMGALNTLTINRAGSTITLGLGCEYPLPINTLALTAGELGLNGNDLQVNGVYSSTSAGTFMDVGSASALEFFGTTGGDLYFSGTGLSGHPEFGELNINSSGVFTLQTIMTLNSANVYSGTLATGTGATVTFGGIQNAATMTLGADASVIGLCALTNVAANFNVGAHILTFNGDITGVSATFGLLNAGNTSTLIFNGSAAFVLPSNITELLDLTINRSGGITMEGDLDVKGTLTLTDGQLAIGGHKLTINHPMSGTLSNLISTNLSSLAVGGTVAGIHIPALGSLSDLILNNTSGATVDGAAGAISIYHQLTLTNGLLSGSDHLNILVGRTIQRSQGSLATEPVFFTSVNVTYTDASPVITGYELPASDVYTTNVTVNKVSDGVTLGFDRTIDDLTLTTGNFAIGSHTLTLRGNLSVTAGQLTGTASSNLVLEGTAAISLPSGLSDLNNLTIDRTGGVTLGGNLALEGVLRLTTGNFNLGNNRLTLKNPIAGTASNLIENTSSPYSSITLAGITPGGLNLPSTVTVLEDLTLENPNGTALQGPLSLNSLTLNSGKLTLGAFDLSTTSILGTPSSGNYVIANTPAGGSLIISGVSAAPAVLFPIGYSDASYSPLTISNTVAGATFKVSVKDAKTIADFIYPLPSSSYVQKQWNISRTVGSGEGTVIFTWPVGEGFGGSPTEVGHSTGSPWLSAGLVSAASTTSVTVSGITAFSSFAAYGDRLTTVYVNDGTGDDSWTGENPTNITPGRGPKKTITAGTTVVAEGGTVIVAGTSYAESGVTITKNLTLNSSGTFTINNYLTVSGGKTITLTGDLIVGGALTLTSASDILTIGANKTLTLNGSISGDGYLAGTGFSNLTISGSSGAFGTMNVMGALNTLTINRAGSTITLGLGCEYPLPINTLALTAGELGLNGNDLQVNGVYSSTSAGTFMDVGSASALEFFGTTGGDLYFSGTGLSGHPEFGELNINSSGVFTLQTIMTLNSANVYSGTLATGTGATVTFGGIQNAATMTLGADASVIGLCALTNVAANFNVGAHILTFNGDITGVSATFGLLNAGNTSTLIFNGSAAFVLPSNITELLDLTINRSGGITMEGDLDVKGTLTLTDGQLAIGGHKLTINHPMSGTLSNLISTNLSSLAVGGTVAGIHIPALGSLSDLILNNTSGATVDGAAGAISIYHQLTLTNGLLSGSDHLNILVGRTIQRSQGSLATEPVFFTSVNVTYTDASPVITGYELPASDVYTTNVTVNKVSDGVTLGFDRTIDDLTLTTGNFAIGSHTLTLRGNLSVTAGQLTGTASSNLVLEGTAAISLPSGLSDLNNLTIDRTGGVTLGGNLALEGVLRLTTGNFNLGNNRLTLKNPIAGTASNLIENTSSPYSSITLAGITPGGLNLPSTVTVLEDLTLENPNGTALQGPLSLNSLTLNSGKLTLGAFDLSTTSILGTPSSGNYVIANTPAGGSLIISGVSAAPAVLFPIGYSDASYSPLTISNTVAGATFKVSVKDAKTIADFIYPLPSSSYVQKQWNISRTVGSGEGTVIFTWPVGEGFGGSPTEVGHSTGSPWLSAGLVSAASTTSVTVSGITAFSSFAAYGDRLTTVYVNDGTGDDSWTGENPTNVTPGRGPKKTIQQAIITVANSGTIYVASGNYAENLIVDKSLTISGANSAVSCTGSRGAESVINGGAGTAITIASNGVTISGFTITGATGISDATYEGFTAQNNIITASDFGLNVSGLSLNATDGLTIQNNCIHLTSQLSGSNPTIGIMLSGISGTAAATISGNNIYDGYYGHLDYSLNTIPKTIISGGTITGVMQGVAVLNTITGTVYAPSTLGISGITMSSFAGSYAGSFHAGVYVFTAGGVATDKITATVNGVNVSGTGRFSSDCAGLSFADFSTGAGTRQDITVSACTLTDNLNRGIHVRGANALVDIGTSTFTGNGQNPLGGANIGFGIVSGEGANVTVHNCYITNPASVTGGST
ncbi:MAG: hypothetical protein WCK09_07830, partial [Bacteroidota bacterium]